MAARQDQTLQIALILCAFLILVLGALLFWVNRQRAELLAEKNSAVEEERNTRNALNNKNQEAQSLRTFMGFTEFEDFNALQTKFQDDMQQYGATFSEADRAYRQVLASLSDELRRSAARESEVLEEVKQLNEKLLALEKAKEKQIDEFRSALKKGEEDAGAERRKFNEARQALSAERDKVIKSRDRLQAEERKRAAVHTQQVGLLNKDIEELRENLRRALDRAPIDNPSSEIADGKVTWVNQGTGIAWINLGSNDGLRRQVTFSVFEQDEVDAGKAEKKGSIEVTKILSDHRAEVRITSDNPRNPILPGDWVYSQVWHRGNVLHFALTGVVDFDGDGRNDIQQAKDLIALNGAKLDAVLEKDGKVTGNINVNTRYLVLGEFPSSADQAELRGGWNKMSEAADMFGVDKITLQQFLDQMGYRSSSSTVNFGSGGAGFSNGPAAGSGSRPAAGSGSRGAARRTLYATP